MQILVLGAGRAGLALVRRLHSIGHDVIVVDPDIDKTADSLDSSIIKISGIVFDVDTLKEAGIESVDAVCALTDNQNQNIMAAQIAHKFFKVPNVIVRIFETHELHIFDEAGFVSISSPELTVDAFLERIQSLTDEKPLDTCECEIMGQRARFLLLEIDNELIGCKISEIEDTEGRHVFGIWRNERLILSLPHYKIEKGDRLVLAEV